MRSRQARSNAGATLTNLAADSLQQSVEAQLEAKRYGNASENFRSLLREAQAGAEDARLETLLPEGLASPALQLDEALRRWSRVAVRQAIAPLCLRCALGAPDRLANPSLAGLRTWPVKGFGDFRVWFPCPARIIRRSCAC